MFVTIRVKRHERGLWFRDGDLKEVLGPGTRRFWSRVFSKRNRVEIFDMLKPRFDHSQLAALLEDVALRDELLVVDVKQDGRAVVWKDDRLECILGPGRYAFWKGFFTFEVQHFDVGADPFVHERIDALLSSPDADQWFQVIDVHSWAEGLYFRNGEFKGRLPKGRSVFWKDAGAVNRAFVDLRQRVSDVSGQEIMSRDKVTLRLNLVVAWRVTDAVKSVTVVSDVEQAVYRECQLALRAAVGTRTLDALLAEKETVGDEVASGVGERAAAFGVAVERVGIRDVILPGEMKQILNQVIEAEKRAQANLIQRREETAAARSQANTAKLLADNPVLARMKELEVLESILAGARLNVSVGSTDLVTQMRSLVDAPKEGEEA